MSLEQKGVLSVNGGSSSIKFALFEIGEPPKRRLYGKLDRIGLPGTALMFSIPDESLPNRLNVDCPDYKTAAAFLIDWLEKQMGPGSPAGIGHRIVHGMRHQVPEPMTPELTEELRRFSGIDPDHLPGELELVELFRRRYPETLQIACFDTSFHSTLPRAAQLLPLPRRFDRAGIRRYGFHGLSCAFLLEELARAAGAKAARGRVILAHLGSGSSLTAVCDGKSVDTTMGFTPAGGIPMGTRPGDLDPGAAAYIMKTENLTPDQWDRLINRESGLLGVSEISSDMRDLLNHRRGDIRAAEAVSLFCYQAKKAIGALAAALGGLDTLVFSGGIGENAPEIREQICEKLDFLGIELDKTRNHSGSNRISTDTSRANILVIRTDEESMIARIVCRFISEVAKTPQLDAGMKRQSCGVERRGNTVAHGPEGIHGAKNPGS